jgi:hypothetical protein
MIVMTGWMISMAGYFISDWIFMNIDWFEIQKYLR